MTKRTFVFCAGFFFTVTVMRPFLIMEMQALREENRELKQIAGSPGSNIFGRSGSIRRGENSIDLSKNNFAKDFPFVISRVKGGRAMKAWLEHAWTEQYFIDTKEDQILYKRGVYPRDKNLPPDEQKTTIPKGWVNKGRSLKERLRQIQQGRDQIAVLKHMWQNKAGYCHPNSTLTTTSTTKPEDRIFMFAEDDWEICEHFRNELNVSLDWAVKHKDRWTGIRFARGNGAVLLQCRDLPQLTSFLDTRKGIPAIDWSVDLFLAQYNPTPTRMYRVTAYSMFRHDEGALSTIWENPRGDDNTGCSEMISVDGWYTGFDFEQCALGDQGRFLLSPCMDHSILPLPMIRYMYVTQ